MFEKLTMFLAQAATETAEKVANAGDKATEGATEGLKAISKLTKGLTGNAWLDKAIEYGISVVGALLLLIVGIIIAKLIKKAVIKGVQKGLRDDGTSPLPRFIGSGVYWGIVVIVVLACLSIFGIETTSFAAILAAAGL
ncbi:MAG: mechanosensitive ion channel family protein, partial [Clostridia bacterium]|nr:mechanosensitive ion channel family protein [Clostridia bacterium]